MTNTEFNRTMASAITMNRGTFTQSMTIDIAAAWTAYTADPARWALTTDDNPTGDPCAAIILADGPWWVAFEIAAVAE